MLVCEQKLENVLLFASSHNTAALLANRIRNYDSQAIRMLNILPTNLDFNYMQGGNQKLERSSLHHAAASEIMCHVHITFHIMWILQQLCVCCMVCRGSSGLSPQSVCGNDQPASWSLNIWVRSSLTADRDCAVEKKTKRLDHLCSKSSSI